MSSSEKQDRTGFFPSPKKKKASHNIFVLGKQLEALVRKKQVKL